MWPVSAKVDDNAPRLSAPRSTLSIHLRLGPKRSQRFRRSHDYAFRERGALPLPRDALAFKGRFSPHEKGTLSSVFSEMNPRSHT